MKSYTDIEQSKKLAEILPLESADMRFCFSHRLDGRITGHYPMIGREPSLGTISCWSLAALMSLLPSEFTIENEFGKYKYEIKIRKYKLTDNVDIHQITYGNYRWHEDGSSSWSDMINSGEREELIDACYDMIISLHELKLL